MATKLPKKIRADKELQSRVGTGKIDQRKIDAAQKLMDNDATDFAVLAKPDLDMLQKALDAAKQDIEDSSAVLDSFIEPIMNLKANAGSFKYEFVSQLTGLILILLESLEKPDKKLIQIVDVLHKTILLALAYQMKGEGGANGKALVEAFKEICTKYKPAE